MIPSGKIGEPGVRGDNGECSTGVKEAFLGAWSAEETNGVKFGEVALCGGKVNA